MTENERIGIRTQLELSKATEKVIERIQRELNDARTFYGIPELNQACSLLDQVTTRLLDSIEKLEDAQREVAGEE